MMAGNREIVQRRILAKGFTGNFSVFLDDVVAEPRSGWFPSTSRGDSASFALPAAMAK